MKPVALHIIQGLGLTGPHTSRISITQIALESESAIRIESHGPERTRRDTHPAANAQIGSNHHPVKIFIAVNGLIGAYGKAGRIFTVLAGCRQKESVPIAFTYDMNTGKDGIMITRVFF
jgi:hypothetical protein